MMNVRKGLGGHASGVALKGLVVASVIKLAKPALDRRGGHSWSVRLGLPMFAAAMTFSSVAIADTGGLRIAVTDVSGAPLAGVEVSVSSPDSLVSKDATTDENGEVRLFGLDPATNYTVEVRADGYSELVQGNVAVVSGRSLALGYKLASTSTDLGSTTVTGESLAAIDVTSATVSTDITLDLTESLPTGRSYQSYLQLVPGTKPSADGNPSSKSGVNYSDIGGDYGSSSDNVYYIDGLNVTDNQTGTFGSNLNSEIIQEQQVLTGGIPAEYAGGAGLVSRVVTKSGGNEFHGSVNYYFQNDSLVEDYDHSGASGFEDYDTAITLGGPIIKDKIWFFGSYQKKNRQEDITDPNTGDFLRSVETDQNLGFGKLTWQVTDRDRLTATFFNDPYERDGTKEPTTVNARSVARDQGGDNYKLEYSHSWDYLYLNVYGFKHEGEVSNSPANGSTRNDVAYLTGNPTNNDLQLGGSGSSIETHRDQEEYGLSLEYLLYTAWGEHALKAGVSYTENIYKENLVYTGPESAQYTSIAAQDIGASFAEYIVGEDWTGPTDLVGDDAARIADAANASADSAYYLSQLDADNSGIIEVDEVSGLVFDSTAGNPNDQVNVYRIVQTETAPLEFKTKGKTIYVQDSWTYNQWTVNAGLRAEEWSHYATDGSKIFTFDWEVAPRLSLVYDIHGDGRSKVWAFGGRYYDPIRTDMTTFAGTLTGSVREEQVFIGDRWLTFRTRGGSQVQDAFFSPNTKTPYTDEFMLGYSRTLSRDMSFSFTYTKRETKDILEDYDLGLYTEELEGTDYYIPLSYFGYNDIPPSNYVIGTLKGGKREYDGYEFVLRKLRSDNWQALVSYTYNDAQGNSNSDGNADFQGDVVWLDPRAPGIYADQPGNIKHQIKLAGSYFWNNGLEVGAVFNFNSGVLYSNTFSASGRHLPIQGDEAYEDGGLTQYWVDEDAVGSNSGPAYGTLDLRVKYTYELIKGRAEFFLDVFNVLNDQSATREQDLVGGDGVYDFGQPIEWVAPRRFYLGARYSF